MALPPPILPPRLTPRELDELFRAKSILENPGLTARLASVLGRPLESGFKLLPKNWSKVVNQSAQAALLKALQLALATLGRGKGKASEKWHQVLAGASGGIGGAIGLAALPVELPLSTTLMLRSIAEIARDEGLSLAAVPTRLACLEVFALGGESSADDAAESGYWAVRAALAKSISDAAAHFARRGALEKSAPAVVRLVSAIAARFGVVVSEQVAAKAVPIVGAAGGTIVNVLFMRHFQEMARGHFIVKRLEAKYGAPYVREVYLSLAVPV